MLIAQSPTSTPTAPSSAARAADDGPRGTPCPGVVTTVRKCASSSPVVPGDALEGTTHPDEQGFVLQRRPLRGDDLPDAGDPPLHLNSQMHVRDGIAHAPDFPDCVDSAAEVPRVVGLLRRHHTDGVGSSGDRWVSDSAGKDGAPQNRGQSADRDSPGRTTCCRSHGRILGTSWATASAIHRLCGGRPIVHRRKSRLDRAHLDRWSAGGVLRVGLADADQRTFGTSIRSASSTSRRRVSSSYVPASSPGKAAHAGG